MTHVFVLHSVTEILAFETLEGMIHYLKERAAAGYVVYEYSNHEWQEDLLEWARNPGPNHPLRIAEKKWNLFVTKCPVRR
jgi:hypothetical protein